MKKCTSRRRPRRFPNADDLNRLDPDDAALMAELRLIDGGRDDA